MIALPPAPTPPIPPTPPNPERNDGGQDIDDLRIVIPVDPDAPGQGRWNLGLIIRPDVLDNVMASKSIHMRQVTMAGIFSNAAFAPAVAIIFLSQNTFDSANKQQLQETLYGLSNMFGIETRIFMPVIITLELAAALRRYRFSALKPGPAAQLQNSQLATWEHLDQLLLLHIEEEWEMENILEKTNTHYVVFRESDK
jgi:hypothetical protein